VYVRERKRERGREGERTRERMNENILFKGMLSMIYFLQLCSTS
jgi:hypothetical protein